jgi:hypothetical protein
MSHENELTFCGYECLRTPWNTLPTSCHPSFYLGPLHMHVDLFKSSTSQPFWRKRCATSKTSTSNITRFQMHPKTPWVVGAFTRCNKNIVAWKIKSTYRARCDHNNGRWTFQNKGGILYKKGKIGYTITIWHTMDLLYCPLYPNLVLSLLKI